MEGRGILMKIIRGKISGAKKTVIYGPEGIGKSTFAAQFPNPIFIDTEGSTKDMDVSRTETPSSWAMLLEHVRYFTNNPEGFQTLCIDTADWAEQLCISSICDKYQKSGIEDFGYGKGYVYLQEEFGRLLNFLTDLVERQDMNVVLTAHAKMRKFEQPDELGAYDRWEMKLTKQVAPMVKEWADMVLFANYKTWSIAVDDKGQKRKAQGGKRVMYTQHHSCWDAKNRYGLPEETEFDYGVIRHIIEPDGASQATEVRYSAIQKEAASVKTTVQGAERTSVPKTKPDQQEIDLQQSPAVVSAGAPPVDPRVPKKLRDLMIANQVDEWDIQGVVESRGYFPGDMPVWEYPEDFVEGCLVAAWDQVYKMIQEMKEKDALVFN